MQITSPLLGYPPPIACLDRTLKVPYNVDHPPCHIRVKQFIVFELFLIAGVGLALKGFEVLTNNRESDNFSRLTEIEAIFCLIIPGLLAFLYAFGSAAGVWCCPRDRLDRNKASCLCLPCVSAPCDTCHCVEDPPA